MMLPLPAGARDALTALWYLRSLPVGPGLSVVVPVSDGGRSLTLTVTGGTRETVSTPGGPVESFRVEPHLTARVERRQPIRATIWLSADRRRVPLVADIDAGFGHVRLMLVDYRP